MSLLVPPPPGGGPHGPPGPPAPANGPGWGAGAPEQPLEGPGFPAWPPDWADFCPFLVEPPPASTAEAAASLLPWELEQLEGLLVEAADPFPFPPWGAELPLSPPAPPGLAEPPQPPPPPPASAGERRQKKRHQNKTAALRYRRRKRAEAEALGAQCRRLEARNGQLREEAASVERELQYVKDLLIEVYKARRPRAP